MPFPLAHPAAVLPLIRRPFVASALVAGAVAPDLLYVDPIYRFATQQIHGNLTLTLTHKFSSVLWLDPLLALLILLLFQWVVQRPLLALAPPSLAGRLPSPAERWKVPTPGQAGWIVVSLVVGAFTHVLWDSFTHYDGYFVMHWSWLQSVNRQLQYLSTFAGLLAIVVWLGLWWRRTSPGPSDPTQYVRPAVRYGVLAGVAVFAAALATVYVVRAEPGQGSELAVRLGLTGLFLGPLVALAWYVLIWHLVRLTFRRDATDGAV